MPAFGRRERNFGVLGSGCVRHSGELVGKEEQFLRRLILSHFARSKRLWYSTCAFGLPVLLAQTAASGSTFVAQIGRANLPW